MLRDNDHLQPIVILRDDPVIEALYKEIIQSEAECEKKIDELKAMAERIRTVQGEKGEALWNKVLEDGKARGLIPATVEVDKTHKLGVIAGTLVMQAIGGDAEGCPCIGCAIRRMLSGDS